MQRNIWAMLVASLLCSGSLADDFLWQCCELDVAEFAVSADSGSSSASVEPALLDPDVTPVSWLRHRCGTLGPDPTGEDFPTVAVTGFFQADALFFVQDDANKAIVGDAQDVADFRRTRLAAKGKVASNVDYMVEFDFAFPGRPSFMEVYVDVADFAQIGHLRVGQWRQPMSMDGMTSVRELIFLERALSFSLVPFRQIGVGLYDTALDESATWAISAYRFPTDVFGDVAGDGGYGMSTRETVLLYEGCGGQTVHLGGGYSYNRPGVVPARFRTAPEVGFNQLDFRNTDFPVPFFVDTGPVPTDSYQLANVELAGTSGPWLYQSEYYFATLDPEVLGNSHFHGGYAQLAYALTGETHAYNKAMGAYGRIIPHHNYGDCGRGAWELAGRLSKLDLTDNAIDGGVIHDATLGLNWYLNKYTKFQFNYIHTWLERPATVETEADILAARAQLDF